MDPNQQLPQNQNSTQPYPVDNPQTSETPVGHPVAQNPVVNLQQANDNSQTLDPTAQSVDIQSPVVSSTAPVSSSPVVSGPVVGGVTSTAYPQQSQDKMLNPFKKLLGIKAGLITAVLLFVIGTGGALTFFLLGNGSDKSQSMKVSDAFLKALDVGDEEAAKTNSDLNPRMGISSVDVKPLADALSTDLVRHKEEYSNKDGKKRAMATYEVKLKVFETEIIRSWVNLMEKRQGKWVVVNMGTIKDKNNVEISEFSDKYFSGDEDITYNEYSDQSEGVDIEREIDIKAMYGQVESYYAQNGYYPTLEDMNDPDFLNENMPGLDIEALKDPESREAKLASSPANKKYSYEVKANDGGLCDNETSYCAAYTLTATKSDGSVYQKEALN